MKRQTHRRTDRNRTMKDLKSWLVYQLPIHFHLDHFMVHFFIPNGGIWITEIENSGCCFYRFESNIKNKIRFVFSKNAKTDALFSFEYKLGQFVTVKRLECLLTFYMNSWNCHQFRSVLCIILFYSLHYRNPLEININRPINYVQINKIIQPMN